MMIFTVLNYFGYSWHWLTKSCTWDLSLPLPTTQFLQLKATLSACNICVQVLQSMQKKYVNKIVPATHSIKIQMLITNFAFFLFEKIRETRKHLNPKQENLRTQNKEEGEWDLFSFLTQRYMGKSLNANRTALTNNPVWSLTY